VPHLATPALPADTLRTITQPVLPVDGELTLRPWRATDAPAVRTAFADPDIQRWHLRTFDSDAEARAWATAWEQLWQLQTKASWAIVDNTDEARGQVGIRNISLFEASADVSYWVLPAARGAGVAARALTAMANWLFETVRLNRLGLAHSTQNTGSCRVAEKAGFAPEGTHRRSHRHQDGWHDMHHHGTVRSHSARDPGARTTNSRR
jgi:RimJ/RimL family protein N-acetyltransferase